MPSDFIQFIGYSRYFKLHFSIETIICNWKMVYLYLEENVNIFEVQKQRLYFVLVPLWLYVYFISQMGENIHRYCPTQVQSNHTYLASLKKKPRQTVQLVQL